MNDGLRGEDDGKATRARRRGQDRVHEGEEER